MHLISAVIEQVAFDIVLNKSTPFLFVFALNYQKWKRTLIGIVLISRFRTIEVTIINYFFVIL